MNIIDLKVQLLLVVIFWLTPRKYQLNILTVTGICYLIIAKQYYSLTLLAGLSLGSYCLANIKVKPTITILGLISIVIIFSAYKLFQNHEKITGNSFVLIGASFYCLRLIHYLSEAYKRSLPTHSLQQFLSYIFFLPTMVIGPINRFQDFIRDDYRRRWDSKLFISGIERVIFGYFKIVVLANYLVATKLHAAAELSGGDSTAIGAYLLCLEYGLDLYFRFGGYSDIAIGISAMMGFRIGENFNFPFIKSNINKFWQNWHISLSSWCRDYVYSPVASKLRNPALGVIASMLILGLWHEASFRYLAWGMYHGIGIVIWRYWYEFKTLIPTKLILPRLISLPLAILLTFNFVILSFVITRTESLFVAKDIYLTIFKGGLCIFGC